MSKQLDETDKRLSKRMRMGVVAALRQPGVIDRAEAASGIRAFDAGLSAGSDSAFAYSELKVSGLALKLEPLSPSLGTVIHGLDLEKDLERSGVITFLRNLWLDRRVIMFRGQSHMTTQGLINFAEHFGEVGAHHGERNHIPTDLPTPDLFPDVLRLISDEKNPNAASEWHSDATWSARPPMGSVLICRQAPPLGGDTNFCDAYGLWEGLRSEVQQRVKKMKARHVGQPFHAMDGEIPQAIHPVARTHPETGRTALFVNRVFCRELLADDALEKRESKDLLNHLCRNIGRPEISCRFRWTPGSVAMWDNRAVQHCATADFWPHKRLMERVTILDREQQRRVPYFHDK
jgi:taurine dioxygenase